MTKARGALSEIKERSSGGQPPHSLSLSLSVSRSEYSARKITKSLICTCRKTSSKDWSFKPRLNSQHVDATGSLLLLSSTSSFDNTSSSSSFTYLLLLGRSTWRQTLNTFSFFRHGEKNVELVAFNKLLMRTGL